jgi:D-alanyl-lipoteichoic acid acyltransferase DltB (MBOAT superfamily)
MATYTFLQAVWLRRGFIAFGSAAFLWLQHPEPVPLLTLLGFVASGFVVARILAWRPSRTLLVIYIVALTVTFVLLKRYDFLRLLPGDTLLAHTLDLVGLSFIFFRQIHYVVDVAQREIGRVELLSYLCYQLNPFSLLAGPIHRYQRFAEDWQSLKPLPVDAHRTRMAMLRILLGYIQVSVIAELCLWVAMSAPGELWRIAPLVKFYFFPAYVFFNFAGYCSIVIAGASLFGIRLPENFDRPYLARNMIDYWNRWHISLSTWIRDYVFTPVYMALARARPKQAPSLVFACYFLALFLAGVWHGASWNFVMFGLLNGLGVSATKLWENLIIARGGRKGLRAYMASQPILWAARFVTINFVCLTMVFLRPDGIETLGNAWLRLQSLLAGIAGG